MPNFLRDFNQGLDIGNKFNNVMNNKERQEKEDARNKVLEQREDVKWQQGLEDRDRLLKENKEDREYKSELRDLTLKTTRNQESRAQSQEHRAQVEFNNKTRTEQLKKDSAIVHDQMLKAISTKDFSWFKSDEASEIYGRNGQLDPRWITSDETVNAVGYLSNVMNAASNGELPQWNDPKLVDAVQKTFPELVDSSTLPTTTEEGKRITGRKITGIVPLEGGKVAIQMDITDEDGKTYSAPMTVNRTHLKDDNVAIIGMDKLTTRIRSIQQAQQDQIFKETSDYLAMSQAGGKKGAASKGTKADLQKEVYKQISTLQNKANEQIANINADATLKPEQKAAQIQQVRDQLAKDQAMTQLQASDVQRGEIRNRPAEARLKETNDFIDTMQLAVGRRLSPEGRGVVKEMYDRGFDSDKILRYLNDPSNTAAFAESARPTGGGVDGGADSIVAGWQSQGGNQQPQGNGANSPAVRNNLSGQELSKLAQYSSEQPEGKSYRPEDIQPQDTGRSARGLDTLETWGM